MRKFLWVAITAIGLSVLMPALAQDDAFDCSTVGVNRQIDFWYNDYLGARGEFETDQALEAAAELAANIEELTTACGFVATIEDTSGNVQTGAGTQEDPFIVLAPAVIGDTTITITNDVRPANQLLTDAGVNNIPEANDTDEYVVIFIDVDCRQGASGGCSIAERSFRLIGDSGNIYEPTIGQYNLYLPGSTSLVGGSSRSGAIPFAIDATDTNLRLVYYPDANPLDVDPEAYYFIAQGTADFIEDVTATTAELIIRNRPSSGGAPVGVLRSGQVATASGRTADGLWIFIEAPEGTGWASAEFLTSEQDLESLGIIDPEEE